MAAVVHLKGDAMAALRGEEKVTADLNTDSFPLLRLCKLLVNVPVGSLHGHAPKPDHAYQQPQPEINYNVYDLIMVIRWPVHERSQTTLHGPISF